jgi:polysaccharide biosynthesis/export protein
METAMRTRSGFLIGLVGIMLSICSAFAKEDVDLDYKLGAGDAIRIIVFQNPDLTLETRVSESGVITYPLIGSVQIGGLTIEKAEKLIARGLREGKYVKQPQVNIILTQVKGNQVSVLGQVNRPGRFPLETFNTNVSDVLALAGGIAETGSDIVVLSGTRDGQPFRKEIDLPAIYRGMGQSENIAVQGGDVIYVDRAPVFYIYGEAQRPGAYRVERGMTIQQALAQGGGPTARGMERWIRLDRKGEDGKIVRRSPDLLEPVLPEDVLYIRESIF